MTISSEELRDLAINNVVPGLANGAPEDAPTRNRIEVRFNRSGGGLTGYFALDVGSYGEDVFYVPAFGCVTIRPGTIGGMNHDDLIHFADIIFDNISLSQRRIESPAEWQRVGKKSPGQHPMTLKNVAYYLENILHTDKYPDGIIVTQDYGGHHHCFIDTNCPEAVKMRKILGESGLELKDIMGEWNKHMEGQHKSHEPLSFDFPDLSGIVKVKIAGQEVKLDLSLEIERQTKAALNQRIDNLRHAEEDIHFIGSEMYRVYLERLIEAGRQKVLPQLNVNTAELVKYKCLVNYGSSDTYNIMFLIRYNPQWIWTGGVRYKLHKKHIEELSQEVYLVFPITKNSKFKVPFLIHPEGTHKFVHYHGIDRDCWGELSTPGLWNGTLKQLAELAYKFQAALATINRDSLMTPEPSGMPKVPDLMAKAKKVGKEDTIEKGAQEITVDDAELSPGEAPRQWGNNTGGEPQEAQGELPPEALRQHEEALRQEERGL